MSAQILIVEDEKLVAADIQGHLEKLGYAVPGIWSTGEEAIRDATKSPPDVVLMDIRLKGRIDGIETARIIQSRLNIPVIYVTAFADDRTLQRAKSTEPYGYVLKPFGIRELQTAIELALHKHSRERRGRNNEQWLLGLIANMGIGLIAIDQAGTVCMMNPKAEEYTGMDLGSALGSMWSDILTFTSTRGDGSDCPVRKALTQNLSCEIQNAPVLFPKTRSQAVISGAVSVMAGPDGGRTAIVVFRDTTIWRDIDERYRSARHLDDLRRLAGGLAHHFSNYLTLVSGYSEALSRSFDQADPRFRDVRTIQKVAERASNLTRGLLSFSRNQPVSPRILNPNHAISSVLDVIKLAVGPSVTIQEEMDASAGKVEVDPTHLDQILTALIENAREAMPDGGPITIRTSNLEVDLQLASRFVDLAPGSYVRIDVSDHGMGMSYEVQTHIFEPFFTVKDRMRGTGLGLSAVYGLVKQNRGHIWFESEPKKGTTFSVCLPRVDGLHSVPFSVPRSLHGTESVLVIDDDPEARAQSRDMLLELGYRVLEASSGNEALKICEQQREEVHLVIGDVMMPNMTAAELRSRLAAVRPEVRVLFVSTFSEYALRSHGALDPSLPVLQRPFSTEALARAVRETLGPGRPELLN